MSLVFLCSMLPLHASENLEEQVNGAHNEHMRKFLSKNSHIVFEVVQKLNTPEYSKLVHLNFSSARCGADYKKVLDEIKEMKDGRIIQCRDIFVKNGDVVMQWMIVGEDFEEDPYSHDFLISLKKIDNVLSEKDQQMQAAASGKQQVVAPSPKSLFFGLLVDSINKKSKKERP